MQDDSSNYPRTPAEYRQWWERNYPETPYGRCICGCGAVTNLADATRLKDLWFKGEPIRYVANHHTWKTPTTYVLEDRGYSTACWIWQRSVSDNGYGQMGSQYAHRAYYEHKYGVIPEGYHAHHLCEQKPCVNPDHIQPLTVSDHFQTRPTTKLSYDDKQRIREMRQQGLSVAEIGALFGVRGDTVSKIAPMSRNRRTLSRDEVMEIKYLCDMGWLKVEVASRFGVHYSTVSRIMSGHHYS